MTKSFDNETSADEILDGVDLRGKRVLITGASSGIGLETARVLLVHGADVIGAARETAKGSEVLHDAARQGGGKYEAVPIDLAYLASVHSVANRVTQAGEPLDLVIANAGIMATAFGHTTDGFELQFGTNFLSHFVLVNRMAPLMREGARLIVLSSNAHRMAEVDLDDPNFARTAYDPWVAYARSKTADALLAVGFDQRNRIRGVRAASVHPGVIQTNLVRHIAPDEFQASFNAMNEQHVALGNARFVPKTVEQGAATTVWAGIVADADTIGGRYCEDCGVGQMLSDPNVGAFAPGLLPHAVDPERAEALWRKANELVGERY